MNSAPVQATGSQFLQENTVENSVKGFTKAQVNNIHSLSLIYVEGHLVTEKLQLAVITMRKKTLKYLYFYYNKWDQHLKEKKSTLNMIKQTSKSLKI